MPFVTFSCAGTATRVIQDELAAAHIDSLAHKCLGLDALIRRVRGGRRLGINVQRKTLG